MMQLEMMEKTAGAAEKGASAMKKAGVIQDPDKAAALEAQTTGGA